MIVKVLNYEYTPELQNKSSQAYKDMERNFTAVVKYRLDLINVQFPSTSLFGDDNDDDDDDDDNDDDDNNDLFNYRHVAASSFFSVSLSIIDLSIILLFIC